MKREFWLTMGDSIGAQLAAKDSRAGEMEPAHEEATEVKSFEVERLKKAYEKRLSDKETEIAGVTRGLDTSRHSWAEYCNRANN